MQQVFSLEVIDRLLCDMDRGNWRERLTGCPLGRIFILPEFLAAVYPPWWDGQRRLPSLLPESVGVVYQRHAVIETAAEVA